MNSIKLILFTGCILALTGCATFTESEKQSPAQARKSSLQGCVTHFLAQDVPPKSSLGICSTIYQRWEE
jgi:hypothetical protein